MPGKRISPQRSFAKLKREIETEVQNGNNSAAWIAMGVNDTWGNRKYLFLLLQCWKTDVIHQNIIRSSQSKEKRKAAF